MSRVRVLALLFALCATTVAADARAQDSPSREDLEVASKHFQAGAEFYTAGEFPKAIIEFLKAYNAVPNALFLYNISLSYEKLGNVEDALAAAEKARLGEGLDEETANRNIARIAAFKRWRVAAEVSDDVAASVAAEREAQQQVTTPPLPESQPRFGALGYTGIALGLVGGGLMVGAGVVANGMKADIDAYEEAGRQGDRATFDSLRGDLDGRQTTGKILLFSGLAATSVGVVMVLIDAASGGEARATQVWLAPSANGAVAGLRGRF